jgi:hypothetical protein
MLRPNRPSFTSHDRDVAAKTSTTPRTLARRRERGRAADTVPAGVS